MENFITNEMIEIFLIGLLLAFVVASALLVKDGADIVSQFRLKYLALRQMKEDVEHNRSKKEEAAFRDLIIEKIRRYNEPKVDMGVEPDPPEDWLPKNTQ